MSISGAVSGSPKGGLNVLKPAKGSGRVSARLPKRVGQYAIHGSLGKGGMGEVYLGSHELLERKVALKRLMVGGDDGPEERFRREGRALARLHHQSIVDVYDLFTYRGDLYMVLEHVDGFDASQLLLRGGNFPVDVAALIALRVAEALQHAHYHGIIHRDIKAANVMVARDGEVKLMDFGIARDEELTDLTESGMMIGTPMYMPPEVVSGHKADERSDVYSLGALLYLMLSNTRPFEHAQPENLGHLIVAGRFPKVHKVQSNIPRQLRKIVAKSMHNKREKRYPSAAAMVRDLVKFLGTHCAWANGNERVVTFLDERGVLNDETGPTRFDAGELITDGSDIPLVVPGYRTPRYILAAVLGTGALIWGFSSGAINTLFESILSLF